MQIKEFFGALALACALSVAHAQYAPAQPQQQVQQPAQPQRVENSGYYINSSGQDVHRPAYTSDNAAPPGASAQCGDGTYSFSTHHRGTCSHHGGVVRWL